MICFHSKSDIGFDDRHTVMTLASGLGKCKDTAPHVWVYRCGHLALVNMTNIANLLVCPCKK